MQKLAGKTIKLTRGDTMRIKLDLHMQNGDEYIPSERDEIRFAVKKSYYDAEPLLLIPIPNDSLILTINPEDTKPLDFGTYVYDIQITFADGSVDTFIDRAKFIVTEEVE
jgi:hypothetical protein